MDASLQELMRSFYAAVESGDTDAAMAGLAPDITIRTRLESYTGTREVRRFLSGSFSEFGAKLEIRQLLEPAPDIVVAVYLLQMRGLSTGIELGQEVVDVARFRDGLIGSVDVFSTLDDALASI